MRLAFRIALRFLTSNKGQTILIAMGIGIGISVQIFIGSLIEGLQISLLDATIGSASHITVQSSDKNDPLENYQEIQASLMANHPSITAISPTLTKGAFLLYNENFNQMLFRGFDLDLANAIYKFDEALIEGGTLPLENQILVGKTLAEENQIKRLDTVTIVTAENQTVDVTVSGFVDLKVAALNESWVIGDISLGKDIFGFDQQNATAIEIQVQEPFDAEIISGEMALGLRREDVRFTNWKSANEQLLSGLNGQSTSSLMIQVFVVISVVLGIASVLAITVLQKSKQIGILKAMGVKDSTSSLIFLFQGAILGLLGGILGIIFGLVLLWSFSTFALNPDGTPVVPIFINPFFIGLSGMIAITASTAASIIPAQKSKKLSPIEVIRNG